MGLMKAPTPVNQRCSVARSLTVLGEKWALLIVRDAQLGKTRFSDFRTRLGIAPDVLADRLAKLVDAGILDRRAYREDGAREREEYVLTPAGAELMPVLAALTQWGDRFAPSGFGPATRYVDAEGRPVRLGFVDGDGREVPREVVTTTRGPGALPA
jgi:DNA-binding HxlR family transcriptional regulator